MPAALYRFTAEKRCHKYEKCVADFMAYRFFNGQIKSLEWISYWRENYFCVACEIHWEGSLNKVLFSRAVEKQNYEELLRLSGEKPQFVLLSTKKPYGENQWMDYYSLIIYGATNGDKCIYGDSFRRPIWIDTLPDEFNRYDFVEWNLNFYATSTASTRGFSRNNAYRELVSYDSELNRRGRKIAENTSKLTGKPTYYCLFYRMNCDFDPKKDKCPSCGSNWYRPTQKDAKGLDTFEFCCPDCLLLKTTPTTWDKMQGRGHIIW